MSDIERTAQIVVISALREELDYLLKKDLHWRGPEGLPGSYSYYLGTLENKEGKRLQIAAIPQPLDEMGLIDAAILATVAIFELKPEYLVMIGICGGIEGEVSIGDVIVARQAFHYQHGKLKGDGEFQPELVTEKANRSIVTKIVEFLKEENLTQIRIEAVKESLEIPRKPRIKCHYLDIASADLVNDHPEQIKSIQKFDRKVVAIDMESLAVLKAANLLDTKAAIIKSVSDIPATNLR
ncbi:MAG: hypothetical protein AB4426_14290 [Xenococcaceae cyanobacterium]